MRILELLKIPLTLARYKIILQVFVFTFKSMKKHLPYFIIILVLFSCKKEPVSEHFIDGSWYVSTYLPLAMVPDTGLYKLQKFDIDDITMNVNQKLNLVTIHNQKFETFPFPLVFTSIILI